MLHTRICSLPLFPIFRIGGDGAPLKHWWGKWYPKYGACSPHYNQRKMFYCGIAAIYPDHYWKFIYFVQGYFEREDEHNLHWFHKFIAEAKCIVLFLRTVNFVRNMRKDTLVNIYILNLKRVRHGWHIVCGHTTQEWCVRFFF